DDGAFGCARADPDKVDRPSVSSLSTPAEITAVGGTTLLGDPAGNLREVAWAGPIERTGSGGGLSTVFARPAWQRGPGVDRGANGSRQVPDVAALGDPLTGWQIIQGGNVIRAGGTSAAAPLWAGLVALIDQDLHRHNKPPVGFMNPALYAFGAATPPPYHDVVAGTNLLYTSGSGWDFATGWGSPDAAALLAAFEARAAAGSTP
ncbi:MAG: peptidase S53, partial [Candidatus Dormibacteria bacterium]